MTTLLPIVFTDLEIKARELLAKRDPKSIEQVMVANVFRAMWGSALPAKRVNEIAAAMMITGYDLQPALTEMVKTKILRSRMVKGVRVYEVNY